MHLILLRDFFDKDYTYGELHMDNGAIETLERPWVPCVGSTCGTKGISCVPNGTYKLERHSTDAHARTWALVNRDLGVLHWPQSDFPLARTTVLIHPANYVSELRGCIAVGLVRGKLGKGSIADSLLAFNELSKRLPWNDLNTLEIGDKQL